MWRFVVLTFGFLGFAFYQLSGGANYAPVENSIQARTDQPEVASPTPERATPAIQHLTTVEELRTTRLQKLGTETADRFEVTLASAQTTSFRSETVRAAAPTEPEKVALLTDPDGADPVDAAVAQALTDTTANAQEATRKIWPGAIELFSQQQMQRAERRNATPTQQGDDIRYVTGKVVNMRGGPGTGFARITSLTQGTKVAVLDTSGDGWLMLRVTDTGEEGWMADWLVSAAAD